MSIPGGSAARSRQFRLFALASSTCSLLLILYLSWLHSDTHQGLEVQSFLPGRVSEGRCNAYDEHGYLNYNATNGHDNRWTPYDPTCKAPQLMASFMRKAWAKQAPSQTWWIDHYKLGENFDKQPEAPDGRPWKDVEWARGRTVLVIGDSISRFTTNYFCELAGEPFVEIGWDHPWSPKVEKMPPVMPEEERVPYTGPTMAAQSTQAPSQSHGGENHAEGLTASEIEQDAEFARLGQWQKLYHGNDKRDKSHNPHYCYIPGLDFLLVHQMWFGLDQSQFWLDKEFAYPPYTFEERMDALFLPILERIRDQTGRTTAAPELTYVHSAMWDLARFTREDIMARVPFEENLSHDRLTWYRTRVRQALAYAARALPQTHIKWLSTHYPLRVSDGWFYEGHTPELKLNRLVELHEAAMSAIEDTEDASRADAKLLSRIEVNKWGLHMRGSEKHQVDGLHPNHLPGGMLWADMMLWDLREAVTGWKFPWSR